jgi:alginate O-acetyltransferase complex protein AlgI
MIIFPSWGYFIFLAAVLLLYWRLPRQGQNLLLLTASYIFYASWDWRFLGLMIGATLLVFFFGLHMKRAQGVFERKAFFFGAVFLCLGMLGFFKYYNFFVDSLAGLLGAWHIDASRWHLEIILPLGISFYTFQLLSYVIDIERGVLDPPESLLDFALFVAFFAKIVAGPFEKPKAFLAQVARDRIFSKSQFTGGIDLIVWGLVKKLVVANNLGLYVNMIFDLKSPSVGLLLLGGFGFGIQLFADFSGYTDLARGSAKLMGLELTRNFDKPFLARNPPDFWNRWHMSLMQWVKDYLYTPLAIRLAKKHPFLGYTIAITLSWGFIGFWHGAEWRYVIWGLYHALLIILFQLIFKPVLDRLWKENFFTHAFSVLTTYLLINVGFLLFRAPSLGFLWGQIKMEMPVSGRNFFEQSFGDRGMMLAVFFVFLFYSIPLLVSVVWQWWQSRKSWDLEKVYGLRVFFYAIASILLIIFAGVDTLDFIYFKF